MGSKAQTPNSQPQPSPVEFFFEISPFEKAHGLNLNIRELVG
jgi:hypothetical protein